MRAFIVQTLLCVACVGTAILGMSGFAEQPTTGSTLVVDESTRVERAREAVTLLAERFRTEIAASLKEYGVAGSISVCQSLSPDLATQAADASGFEITRTSQRLRNPESAPDAWEAKVLQSFHMRVLTGSDVSKLEYAETVVSPEGDKVFRYMKAIPVAEPCLACHGGELRPDVKAEIARAYPEDKATGYRLGDLRGAFSLTQIIEE